MADRQYTPLRPCRISGCTNLVRRRGFICGTHRDRFYRTGSFELPLHPPEPDLPGEEWRPVVGSEDVYAISNFGRLRRVAADPSRCYGRILRAVPDKRLGYRRVILCHPDGAKRHVFIHVLVLEAFIGPRPLAYHVNHIDSNPSNCHLSNLEYVTPRENTMHSIRVGRTKYRLTPEIVRAIRASSASIYALARMYGVSDTSIRAVRKGKTWQHVT